VRNYFFGAALIGFAMAATSALAGPPYFSDDPEPTDYQHFEIYAFGDGTITRDGNAGSAGIDFNYGGLPDLQLTAVLPLGYQSSASAHFDTGLGNAQLAAKYRFLHQEEIGWDVAVFPRLFLPSSAGAVGPRHASLLLPFWLERAWDDWSTFGGGGCAINRGGDSKDFCLMGWTLTRQILSELQIGIEIYHQTADAKDGHSTTGSARASSTISLPTIICWRGEVPEFRTLRERMCFLGTRRYCSPSRVSFEQ